MVVLVVTLDVTWRYLNEIEQVVEKRLQFVRGEEVDRVEEKNDRNFVGAKGRKHVSEACGKWLGWGDFNNTYSSTSLWRGRADLPRNCMDSQAEILPWVPYKRANSVEGAVQMHDEETWLLLLDSVDAFAHGVDEKTRVWELDDTRAALRMFHSSIQDVAQLAALKSFQKTNFMLGSFLGLIVDIIGVSHFVKYSIIIEKD